MTASPAPTAGRVLSADVAVPDHERVVAFYTRVLTTGAAPLWRDDLLNSAGVPIIGVGERIPAYDHLPLQWMPHIQVADVAASAARAREHGGDELMHHRDEQGQSQWAVLRDPDGAAFGIVPAVAADTRPETDAASSDSPERTGRIAGMDLTVPDAAATRDFYAAVIGWSARAVERDDADGRYADYVLTASDGSDVAEVRHARGANRGLPPVWMLHLPVGDLAESLRRVAEAGGAVVRTSGAGAVVRDPVGTHLALVPG